MGGNWKLLNAHTLNFQYETCRSIWGYWVLSVKSYYMWTCESADKLFKSDSDSGMGVILCHLALIGEDLPMRKPCSVFWNMTLVPAGAIKSLPSTSAQNSTHFNMCRSMLSHSEKDHIFERRKVPMWFYCNSSCASLIFKSQMDDTIARPMAAETQ